MKNMKAFNEEFVLVSERLGRLAVSLVLSVQCLVFVVGVFTLAASVSRSSFFLLVGVNNISSSHDVRFVVLAADSRSAVQARSVDTAAVENLQRRAAHGSQTRQASLSTSDILSLCASVRLYSETKV